MTQSAASDFPTPMPAQPVVELRDVTKQFGAVQALRGVHLALYPGEVHALVGENGAGKSTLVKMLGGIHQPDTGAILINGQETTLGSPLDCPGRPESRSFSSTRCSSRTSTSPRTSTWAGSRRRASGGSTGAR